MSKFEWDENKKDSNLRKHKVLFEEATEIFKDENAIEFLQDQTTEVRFLRIGKTIGKVILAVVYTLRDTIIRIISARQANRKEINAYIEHTFTKNKADESEH